MLTGSLAFGGTTYYVQTSGSDASAGTSWAAAFATIQKALSVAASGDQIWVAAGTYRPSSSDVTVSFNLKSGVAVYGGFAGTESTLGERNWQTNITTLSGDINNDGALSGNSYHVVYGVVVNASAILDGFVITGGNSTTDGGGVYLLAASPQLSNLQITGNHATANGGGLCNNGGNPTITNCMIVGNTAANGGGMYNYSGSVPSLTNIAFRNDTAGSFGGGCYNAGGSLTVQDMLFDGNHATTGGGGLYESGASVYLNITFYGNTSKYGGGMFATGAALQTIRNTIFWNDTATTHGSEAYSSNSNNTVIANSLLLGGISGTGFYTAGTGVFADSGHNIGADPLFTDTSSHNFTLTASSPAIDSGKNNGVTAASDLAGNSRISDGTVDLGAYEYQGSPLAVEMTSFNIASAKTGVELRWATTTEVNNYGFDVERRAIDDFGLSIADWKKVGFVPGSGTTSNQKEYIFTARKLSPGLFAYRIKQIDRSGVFKYSSELRVHVGATPVTFMLSQNFPNPFNPTTRIRFSLAQRGRVSLKIFDILGREVTTLVYGELEAGLHQSTFDATKFASGVYFYRIRAGSYTATKKLVLLK